MPYPRWLARINKRVFNPQEIRRGKRPVVIHVGRSSGTVYQTPLDAHRTRQGYVLVVRYGPGSDWVRNIRLAGAATLRVDGREYRLVSPRLVTQQEAIDELVQGFDPGPDFFKAEHYLLMDHSS
ncbi:MAG TPA: nitroreductase family deazaflavin-dependent oxidoreductase [Acidimicrobiia bacterium]|jgi:deazaflavin-dependent oxidoreductase (nitroreductase family)|nr:nitroreductase family deazaflavin-dependent oxidoreductase [Acidimicrobiia bacterium]